MKKQFYIILRQLDKQHTWIKNTRLHQTFKLSLVGLPALTDPSVPSSQAGQWYWRMTVEEHA